MSTDSSFVNYCYIRQREADSPLFYVDGDVVCARLERYAVLPLEEYESLRAMAGLVADGWREE